MRSDYERRAGEYDSWWLGTGVFATRDRPGWGAARGELIATLTGLTPARTLDVACGTGFLSAHLRGELTLLDQSAVYKRWFRSAELSGELEDAVVLLDNDWFVCVQARWR